MDAVMFAQQMTASPDYGLIGGIIVAGTCLLASAASVFTLIEKIRTFRKGTAEAASEVVSKKEIVEAKAEADSKVSALGEKLTEKYTAIANELLEQKKYMHEFVHSAQP